MLGFYDYTVLLTYFGLFSGVLGIIQAVAYGNTKIAVLCLMIAGTCDMFDGKIASTKKNRTVDQKDFGIQIDSMCDLVCFGVLPVCIGLSLEIRNILGFVFMALYILAAVIRLSFYNVQEKNRQAESNEIRKYYRGLPVTTVAIIFPLLFLMRGRLYNNFNLIFESVMLCISVLFVLDFKIKKADKKMMILLVVFGILIVLPYLLKGI